MSITVPDALDHILGYVDNYKDVLNVALSNKVLYSVAVPQHLHYRDIRCSLRNPSLWSWLSRSDDLRAAHIRSLTIIPEDKSDQWQNYDTRQRLPAELSRFESHPRFSVIREAYLDSEIKLVSALKRMSNLQRFRWYCRPCPCLIGTDDIWSTLRRLGTVKEVDVLDQQVLRFLVNPTALSETFLRLRGCTSLKIRTSVCNKFAEDEYPEIPQLEKMLVNNCPELEILALELDHNENYHGTANIEFLLKNARWPNLRVLRLHGVNCRVPELTRFLVAHPTLEDLALARMMPGHAWTQLELPADALPNLRHLECSSAQAAALLKNTSNHSLITLRGVEVHDTVKDSNYFSWDDDWEEENHDDTDENRPSPWKAPFLECLMGQTSITRLGLSSVDVPREMEILSVLVPQIKELDIGDEYSAVISAAEWHRLYSLFPSLETIWAGHLLALDQYIELTTEDAHWKNKEIQALARSCPRLRVILVGERMKKVVIIQGGGPSPGARWVVRKWEENEDPRLKVGELVYGP